MTETGLNGRDVILQKFQKMQPFNSYKGSDLFLKKVEKLLQEI